MTFDYTCVLLNVWSTRDPEEGRKGQNGNKGVLFVCLSIYCNNTGIPCVCVFVISEFLGTGRPSDTPLSL